MSVILKGKCSVCERELENHTDEELKTCQEESIDRHAREIIVRGAYAG